MKRAESVSGPMVLLVEDDSPTREMYAICLRDGGFHVLEAADGSQARALLGDELPDVIVSDLAMPRMSGEQLCRFVRACPGGARVPMLALTARPIGAAVRDVAEAGFCGVVSKPFGPDVLVDLVARFCDQRVTCRDCRNRTEPFHKVSIGDPAALWLRASCSLHSRVAH